MICKIEGAGIPWPVERIGTNQNSIVRVTVLGKCEKIVEMVIRMCQPTSDGELPTAEGVRKAAFDNKLDTV